MQRIPSFTTLSSRSSSRASLNRLVEPLLPYAIISEKATPKLRIRGLLGHFHCKRVFLWVVAVLCLGLVVIESKSRDYHLGWTQADAPKTTAEVLMENGETVVVITGDLDGGGTVGDAPDEELVMDDEEKQAAEQMQRMPWLRFPQFVLSIISQGATY